MVKIHLDWESFSEQDIKVVGAFRYAEDPTTEILIAGWSVDDGEPVAVDMTQSGWLSQLEKMFDLVARGAIIGAHNSAFERVMWEKVGVPKHGFPVTPKPWQWSCTAARARMLALPGSLEGAANALGIDARKDPRGEALIKIFCKPDKKKGRCYPSDRPDDFKDFMEYCRQDVRVEVQLDRILPSLPEIEAQAFQLDFKINDAGMPVNIDRVNAADDFVEEYSERLLAASIEISGYRPTQRDRTLEYLESRGFGLPNLQALTVEALAARPDLPNDLRELMDHRIELSRAGTKKLKAIKACVSSDGRIRGGFLFSAASTRRWSSTGVQMHNLSKPEGECNPQVVLDLLDGDANDLMIMFDRPLSVLAQSVRGFFQSDRKFLVADYASVEPRGLAWSAGEDWLVDAYHKGEDVYKIAAGRVYNKHPSQIAKESRERFVGKQIILGCLGPDTEVLTERGWKRIVDITLDDRLWDGVEFVSHGGVIHQGRKEVLGLCGLVGTPDHRIWIGQRFAPLGRIMEDLSGSLLQSALSSVSLPSSHIGSDKRGASFTTNAGVSVEQSPIPVKGTLNKGDQPGVLHAHSRQRARLNGSPQNHQSSLVSLNLKTISGLVASSVTCTTGWFRNALAGLTGIRSTISGFATDGMISKTSSRMLLPCLVGVRTRSSIEKIISETIHQTIADLSRGQSQIVTVSEVYDIVNSGKRQRFTVRCSRGPLIVHNCGYQMGPDRFIDTCATKAVPPLHLSLKEAEEAVYGYRNSVPAIVAFWAQAERACIKATRKWAPVQFGRFTVRPDTLSNGFPVLYVDMPSGTICYPKPSLGPHPFRDDLNSLNFYTPLGSSWIKTDTFGGSIVENIIQAMCRDVLRDGMLAADQAGFDIVGHCHDEAISEGDGRPDELEEFERLLCTSSPWAEGFPIATEGYVSEVYRK